MKVTVCEMRDDAAGFAADWEGLVEHVRAEASALVLLPEMPFSPWFAATRPYAMSVWTETVAVHDAWESRMDELAPAVVLASRPIGLGAARRNSAMMRAPGGPAHPVHDKRYLPDEDGFWEASWYPQGDGSIELAEAGGARIGFQICTELWINEVSRAYGRQGANIIATPRATPRASAERWIVAGRMAAITAGAYSLSSNHAGPGAAGLAFGGQGWIIDPDGEVLAVTSPDQPFMTAMIDLAHAAEAKATYPRYVL